MHAWSRFVALAAATAGLLHAPPLLAAPPELPEQPSLAPVQPDPAAPLSVEPAAVEPAPVEPAAVEPAPAAPPSTATAVTSEPATVGAPAPEGEALRIVEGPLPAPASEPALVQVVPNCTTSIPRIIGKRPPVGTGMLVGGIAGFVGASMMATFASLGRNELGLARGQALALGLSAVPLTAISGALLVGGIKGTQRYAAWQRDNAIDAPASGNGMLVAGVVFGGVGALATALAADRARRVDDPDIGDRVLTGLSIATLSGGVLLLGGGVIQRARFSAWEGVGYMRPGVYANRSGAGLSLSGRF